MHNHQTDAEGVFHLTSELSILKSNLSTLTIMILTVRGLHPQKGRQDRHRSDGHEKVVTGQYGNGRIYNGFEGILQFE